MSSLVGKKVRFRAAGNQDLILEGTILHDCRNDLTPMAWLDIEVKKKWPEKDAVYNVKADWIII